MDLILTCLQILAMTVITGITILVVVILAGWIGIAIKTTLKHFKE